MKTNDNYRNRLMSIQSNLLNYAYILTSNRDDAYRLLNETTATVISDQSRFEEKSSLKSFALAVMRTIFIKRYRHASREVRVEAPRALPYRMAVTDEAAAGSACIEESRLRRSIDSLEDNVNRIYRLHVAGYSTAEISHIFSLSEDTVAARISSASRRIAASL